MIFDAIDKAASITRTTIEKSDNMCKIDNEASLNLACSAGKINLVLLKKITYSKKAKLMIVVFKKFIQNYFI